jgi:hypothetical protein
MALRTYKGVVVGKGCQLDLALEAKDFTAAEKIHKETMAEYHKYVPKDFDYRSSFEYQDQQDDHEQQECANDQA